MCDDVVSQEPAYWRLMTGEDLAQVYQIDYEANKASENWAESQFRIYLILPRAWLYRCEVLESNFDVLAFRITNRLTKAVVRQAENDYYAPMGSSLLASQPT